MVSSVVSLAYGSDMASVRANGKIVMLCSPHPRSDFVRRDADGFWGIDYEILKTFAASQDIELEVRPVPKFSDLIPWLLQGKGDVIASSFSITDQRRKKVDFSSSYFPVRVMVVAEKNSGIERAEDLKGLRAAVVTGSSLEEFILIRVPDVHIVAVRQTPMVYDKVKNGAADYAPVDSTAAMTDLKQYPGLATAFAFPDRFGYGYAVNKGSDIAQALSLHVDRLRTSGIYYTLLKRVLGPEALDIVKAAESEK